MEEVLASLRDVLSPVFTAAAWVFDRWALDQRPSLPLVLIALAVMVSCCAYRPAWVTLRHGVTIVHEMGHVVVARLSGRQVQGIRLHTDTSGLAITAGRPRGLGVLLTFLAGYTAPPLVGLGLIWASLNGWSGAALTGLMALLLAAFWLVSNLFGLVTVSVALLGAGYVFWQADPGVVTTGTVVVGLFLLVASVRGAFDLWAIHSKGEGQESDAAMAARHSLLPTMFWVWFFGVVGFLCAGQATVLVVQTFR